MQDREPQVGREGRVRIIQDDGTVIEGVLEMADNATIQGTPYNKATQLSDAVAQALKLTPVEEATVNDALGLLPGINEQILALRTGEVKLAYGIISSMGSSHTFELDWEPVMLLLMSTTKPPYFGDSSAGVNYMMAIAGVPEVTGTNISSPDLVWGANSIAVSSLGGSLTDTVAYLIIGRKQLSTLTLSVLNASGEHQDGCVVSFGENDPFVTDGSGPITLQSVANKPVLTVVSPLDYGGEVQTQTLDFSSTQNLSVDVTVDTSTHLTSGTITSSIVGAFSSLAATVNLLCVGGGGNGMMCPQIAWNTAPFASGGSGGGGARKNNYATAGKRFSMTPGGRASTSTIYADDQIICQATGGKNGVGNNIRDFPNDDPSTPAISYSSVPEPGTGIVGDVLMTGAKPAQIMVSGQNTGMSLIYNTSAQQPTAGNVTNLAGTQIAGAGATRSDYGYYDGYYFYPSNGTSTNPTQGGGAIASNATLAGAGGGAAPNGQSAGLGMAGIIEWEVVS